ncbi:hypothetical protein BLNAU_6142 [Blattamonas nauphoetae]|uniref:Uncharacterized protein n=1 Tax=Blattamonas nauphoetae TaxID=2049346 RepID=A0ABQ9Y578_9EUKA|nr:hypothetical protein BLNAU_6142 [Blattamonas nauphoetae]
MSSLTMETRAMNGRDADSAVTSSLGQQTFSPSLELKVVSFLGQLRPRVTATIESYIKDLVPSSKPESLHVFVESLIELTSCRNQRIVAATLDFIVHTFGLSDPTTRLSLIIDSIVPKILSCLNPTALSITGATEILTPLVDILSHALFVSSPILLRRRGIRNARKLRMYRDTIHNQVLTPSEGYIRFLCANRYSIVDGHPCESFLSVLSEIIHTSPSHEPTMIFAQTLPIFLTIPSALMFLEYDETIMTFLQNLCEIHQIWMNSSEDLQRRWNQVVRSLNFEGLEDLVELRLNNDLNGFDGRFLVHLTVMWKNMLGMNQ